MSEPARTSPRRGLPSAAAAVAGLRGRVAGAAGGLFSHGEYPLARTLDLPR